MNDLIGKVIHSRYRVDSFLGSGGISDAYRVWDLKLNVPRAMKVVHIDPANDPSVFIHLRDEASAMKRLAHPHIVPFYGVYQTEDFVYYIEQYIDGGTLKRVLQRADGPMPIEEALIYLKALSSALGYAHSNGVVHGDVKPGNVMIGRAGNIFLSDFGITQLVESMTTPMGGGTRATYLAPEQILRHSVTPATDVYALGVVLFELLIGRPPFVGTEPGLENSGSTAEVRVRYAHLQMEPPDPHLFNPDIPETLASVILRAMSKEHAERYADVTGILDAACAGVGLIPDQIPDRGMLPVMHETVGVQKPVSKRGSTSKMWVAIAVVILLLCICAAVVMLGGLDVVRGLFATDTPAATPTQSIVSTNTPGPTATERATAERPTETPTTTREQGEVPTPSTTPSPTNPPRPTDTRHPPDTIPPTNTSAPQPAVNRITIRNTSANDIYIFMDGSFLGGPIPPNMYMWFNVSGGTVSIQGCWDPGGTDCTSARTVTIEGEVSITLP